jgi:hypothetical protein
MESVVNSILVVQKIVRPSSFEKWVYSIQKINPSFENKRILVHKELIVPKYNGNKQLPNGFLSIDNLSTIRM